MRKPPQPDYDSEDSVVNRDAWEGLNQQTKPF
jgi:hypothetical protein